MEEQSSFLKIPFNSQENTDVTIQGLNQILCGDARYLLADIPEASVDFIFTSPPYANQRKKNYPSVSHENYIAWFMPIAAQLQRVLKPTGTFVLNIKENVLDGERSPYVLELILALRQQGWLWTEEFIWVKKNSCPGKWPNRFRDTWERCLQFNRQRQFQMIQEAVMIPIGNWTTARFKRLRLKDRVRRQSQTGSPFGCNRSYWLDKEKVYPTNVLTIATESRHQRHPAVFPEALPEWFIQLFTRENDIVLDPFVGSGTTAVVAQKLSRRFIGIDISADYCEVARDRLARI